MSHSTHGSSAHKVQDALIAAGARDNHGGAIDPDSAFGRLTREAVIKFAEHLRLRSVLRGVREPYRYEKEVEDFLRWSPSVRHRKYPGEPTRFFPPAPGSGEEVRAGADSESRLPSGGKEAS